jgi:predicted ATP-grasp superfamily ATP-dependent carboligase
MWKQLLEQAKNRLRGHRHIFVYEHVSAGGCDGDSSPAPAPAPASLRAEGRTMLQAVLQDLWAIENVAATTLIQADVDWECPADVRASLVVVGSPPERESNFDEHVRSADGVLLIAPETDGVLAALAERVERLGGRMLSPPSKFIDWATDKSAVFETMRGEGVPMPRGVRLTASDPWPATFPSPAVLKPNDSCGSQGLRLVDPAAGDARTNDHAVWRLEQFTPGTAISLMVLLGPTTRVPLMPCYQTLSDEGCFQYLGGQLPVSAEHERRALQLFERAFGPLPDWQGYIGLDMVLGPADDGSQDYLIEVNPRLTTSYVGLRTMYRTNLMQLLLDVLDERDTKLERRIGTVRFTSDGKTDGVWYDKVSRE